MKYISINGIVLDQSKLPIVKNGVSLKGRKTTIVTPPDPGDGGGTTSPTTSGGDVIATIKFVSAPSSASASITKAKYGKSAIGMFELDDIPSNVIDWLAIFQGGTASISGGNEVMPGKTFTDGCGNNIKWTFSIGVNVKANYHDLSVNTGDDFILEPDSSAWARNLYPSSLFPSLVAKGCYPIPHGYYHQDQGTDETNDWYVYHVNHDGWNKSKNLSECVKYIWDKSGGFNPRYFIVPQDSLNYNVECRAQGLLAQSSQSVYDGEFYFPKPGEEWVHNNSFVDDVIARNGGYAAFLRYFFLDWTTQSYFDTAKAEYDYIVANGTVASPQFRRWGSHAFGPSEWSNVKAFFNYLDTNSGDKVWFTTLNEFLEYLEVRRLITKTETLVGDTLTIRLNYNNIPIENYCRDISLIVNSTAAIQSITINGAQSSSYNTATGLINVFNKRKATAYPFTQPITGVIPVTQYDIMQDNSQQSTAQPLIDGVTTINYKPKDPVIYLPHRIIIDLEKYKVSSLSSIQMKTGTDLSDPSTISVIVKRADTGAEVTLGTFTASGNQTFTPGLYPVSQVILQTPINDNFGSEIVITGTYHPLLTNPYKKPRRPINWLMGANGHFWDLMNDAKLNTIKSLGLKSLRIYDYADGGIQDISGNWNLDPDQGAGRYRIETAFQNLKSYDPTIVKWRAVNRQYPDQLASWHVGSEIQYITGTVQTYQDFGSYGQIALHIDSVTNPDSKFYGWWEVRKAGIKIDFTKTTLNLSNSAVGTTPTAYVSGGLGLQSGDVVTFHKSQDSVNQIFFSDYNNRRSLATYQKQGNAAFVYASRYGKNSLVPDYPVFGGDTVKKGLDLNEAVENGNEPDAWWAGIDGFFNGEDLFYSFSMCYDGHMGQYANTGAKQADPNILVSTSGLATDKLDRIKGAWFKARELRGKNPDGTVNVPWDIIQQHIYSSAEGQYGGSTSGGLPPEQGMYNYVKDIVKFVEDYTPFSQAYVGEWGWDQHPNSPLRAGLVGAWDREVIAASWMVRGILGFSAFGLDRAQYYRLAQDWPETTSNNDSTQFSTMRLMSQPNNSNENLIVRSRQGDYMKQLSEFGNYTFDQEIDTGITGVYCYQYKNGSNTIIALWSEEQTTIVSNSPVFTERTGIFQVPVPNNANLIIRQFVDDGSGIMASQNVTAVGTTYPLAYDSKPKIIQVLGTTGTVSYTTVGRQRTDTFKITDTYNATASVWVPTTYDTDPQDTAYPLIVFFHGVGEAHNPPDMTILQGTGIPQLIKDGWNVEATDPVTGLLTKFIVVSPQHTYFSWGADGTFSQLPKMLDSIIAKYRVDTKRIYYAGLSAGAQGVVTAVTNDAVFAKRIAAISPVSFTGWNSPTEQTNTSLIGGTYHVPMWAAVGTSETYYSRAVDLKTRYNSVTPSPLGVIDEIVGGTHSASIWNTFFKDWKTNPNNTKGDSWLEWLLRNKR